MSSVAIFLRRKPEVFTDRYTSNGYSKHWSKHCREYNACGERVFFVQDNWYSQHYAPREHEQHRERHDDHDH